GQKSHVQLLGDPRQPLNVVEGDPLADRAQRGQSIEGAAVQQFPAQMAGQQLGDGSLAGAAGAVDGYDGSLGVSHPFPSTCSLMPTFCASSTKLGNDVATLAQSRIRISPWARREATAKDMAMR